MTNTREAKRLNWAERHLNWTWFLISSGVSIIVTFILLVVVVAHYPQMLDKLDILSTIVNFVPAFLVGVWYLVKKDRSLWNLLWLIVPFVGVIIFLCLENRGEGREVYDVSPEIDEEILLHKHNECPECGSSNINKAIKRMAKTEKEIEANGFKTEWDCLCLNCRHEWLEREK